MTARLLKKGVSFSEVSHKGVNTAELVAKLICQGNDLVDGIEKMFSLIKGSCSRLMLTRSIHELSARKAIRSLEGHDRVDISEYLDSNSEKYKKMIDWIAQDLGVTTLRYQTVDDMVEAMGLPKHKLCLYCWTGQCPKSACERTPIDIQEIKKGTTRQHDPAQTKLW